MSKPIFCVQCRHCGPVRFAANEDVTICSREVTKTVSLVTGSEIATGQHYAESQRKAIGDIFCGPDARFFAPKLEAA